MLPVWLGWQVCTIVSGFLLVEMESPDFLPRLASNHDSPDLRLLSSWWATMLCTLSEFLLLKNSSVTKSPPQNAHSLMVYRKVQIMIVLCSQKIEK
jgi:hypothetical protein